MTYTCVSTLVGACINLIDARYIVNCRTPVHDWHPKIAEQPIGEAGGDQVLCATYTSTAGMVCTHHEHFPAVVDGVQLHKVVLAAIPRDFQLWAHLGIALHTHA